MPTKPTTTSMTVGERIRNARKKLGLSQVELAKRAGVSRGAIYQWENDLNYVRPQKIPRLAAVLGLSPSALSPFGGGTASPTPTTQKANYVALIAWDELIAIGAGGKMKMSAITKPRYIEVDVGISPESIALRINDNSMEPSFRQNDVIIVDPNIEPVENDHVLVRLQTDEHLFRLYTPRRGGAYDLTAENPDYPTVTINQKFPAKIVGVLVEHRKKRHG